MMMYTLLQGEQTYLPRLIAVDLSGSLKSLKAQGELYDVRSDTVPWYANTVCILS